MQNAIQPDDETKESVPGSIEKFEGRGWLNIWGFLLLAWVCLLGMCAYWIFSLGLGGAIEDDQFGYAAFFCCFIGICLIGRWTVPNLLREGSSVDPRNVHVLRDFRSGWYLRGRNRRQP